MNLRKKFDTTFEWDFQCLPARHWKWRQAGSALHFTQRIPNSSSSRFPEFMAISGMIDLAHLRAMRPDLPPFLYYCHENQFAYPLSEHEPMDFRYGFTDLASFLASRTVVFNSQYNKDSFLDSLKALFHRLPDAVPSWTLEALQSKSFVVYPGVEEPPEIETCQQSQRERPLIVWNHRHEHDKDPTSAYEILMRAKKLGMEFDFALLGERFTSSPGAFDLLRKDFKSQILVDSFASRDTYRQWLRQGSVVLSTAIQENFGISIVEAALAGCLPLVPKRLAYPEVLPLWSHCSPPINDRRHS